MIDPLSTAAGAAVAASASRAIEKTTTSLIDKISFKFAKDKYDVLRFTLSKGLPLYLNANYAKCETLKTLLNRNDPISLQECFVAPDFKFQREIISSEEFFLSINSTSGKVIITGLAGSGKSVFLKHSFRRVIENGHSYYPIFFELRALNRAVVSGEILLSEIFKSIHECCASFTRTQFNHGLKSGAFYFLLDGFDELNQDIREQVSNEINAIARIHNKCVIIVTSRPSDEFIAWEGFSEAKLQPFSLEKAITYISKLKFDEEKKGEFLEDLKGGMFEKNKDFLSNPLLSAMMLLTYDSFGEIPEKRHIFYSKCFDVLAREHDSSKGRYKRALFSSLTMDQIEKSFMFFCAISYVDRVFSFNDEQMEHFVREAVSACGLDAVTTEVIRDFRESISIMERVGLIYEFAHRSFQEYFYAKFVIADRRLSLDQKIGWLANNLRSDDTLEMIADMDRTYFEDEFLLPKIIKLDQKISGFDPQSNPAGILSRFYGRMHTMDHANGDSKTLEKRVVYSISSNENHFLLRQARTKYLEEHFEGENNLRKNRRDENEVSKIIDDKYNGEIKIHHSNNKKLLEADANFFAASIKELISSLRTYLEVKQGRRRNGLGALIRKEYKR